MAAVLLVACATGVSCGLARLKIWIIIPASVIFLLVTVVLDSRFAITWSSTALISFSGLTLLQVSYLIGTVGPHYRARNKDRAVQPQELRRVVLLDRDRGIRHQVSGHLPKQQMLRTVQMAIASELRGHFVAESLNDLPEHLRAKVAMLESHCAPVPPSVAQVTCMAKLHDKIVAQAS